MGELGLEEVELRARGVEQHGEPARRPEPVPRRTSVNSVDQHRSRQQNHQDLRADQRQPGSQCAPRTTTRNDWCLPEPVKSAYGVLRIGYAAS